MQLRRSTSNKPPPPAGASKKQQPFCILRWGPYPKEGVVIKNERLATSTIVWVVTSSLYVWACLDLLLFRFRLLTALGIIACMTPCFIVVRRAIADFEMAYTEDYAMGLPDNDHAGNLPVGNMSSVV